MGEGAGVLASPERGGAARKRGGGVRCGTQNTNWDAPRRIRTGPLGFPRGEAKRGLYVFAQDFIRPQVPAVPLSLALLDSSPNGGAKGGLYEFARDFIRPQVPTAKPLCDSLRAA